MNDMRVGAAFRAVRVKRRWRQQDVADRAGVSRSFVSLVERGHMDQVSLATLRRLARVLDIRIDLYARWRGGELDRLLNRAHSSLHESVARHMAQIPGWAISPEVSYSVYGERGVVDILAFHEPTQSLLVIELKTSIVDVNELVGRVDQTRRLAARIAADRGWLADTVSSWVIVGRSKTNQRRIADHRSMLRAAFPSEGPAMRAWLRRPDRARDGLSLWTYGNHRSASPRPGRGLG